MDSVRMMITRRLMLALVLCFSAGCMQIKALPHLDEVLVLKDYSDEKEAQEKWIGGENKKFEKLLAAVKDGSVKTYTSRDAVVQAFGSPVLIDVINEKDKPLERWLYRHPIQKMATERVCFYFDENGRTVKYEQISSQ